jgi:hypothetical protein
MEAFDLARKSGSGEAFHFPRCATASLPHPSKLEVPMAEQAISSQTEHPVTPRTERRAWVRFHSDQEISCGPVGVNAIWLGRVRNVSRGGIAVIVPRQFHPGTTLSVELLRTTTDGLRRLVVRVVHAKQEEKDYWLMGCVFARPLSEKELQVLIAE